MNRRDILRLASASTGLVLTGPPAARADEGPASELHALAAHSGGRLGVFALDTRSGRALLAARDMERFPMCSTFKLLAVAAVLARVDAGSEQLDRRIAFGRSDIVEYSPVTSPHGLPGSLSVRQLCAAAIEASDNTAANLLLNLLGGPAQVTAFVRLNGDRTTRLDRTEPSLNTAIAGDPRDTTTPRAMAQTVAKLVTGDVLAKRSRAQLTAWLLACTTGTTRLRAGLPAGWRVGDKTGTGAHGTANDVAVIWPPGSAPIVVAAYLTGATVSPDARDATIAAVARVFTRTLAR